MEQPIKVRCHTNIDKFKMEKWPTMMACRPIKGDAVEAVSGVRLYVEEVTHVTAWDTLSSGLSPGQPFLRVELHSPYVNFAE